VTREWNHTVQQFRTADLFRTQHQLQFDTQVLRYQIAHWHRSQPLAWVQNCANHWLEPEWRHGRVVRVSLVPPPPNQQIGVYLGSFHLLARISNADLKTGNFNCFNQSRSVGKPWQTSLRAGPTVHTYCQLVGQSEARNKLTNVWGTTWCV